MEENVNIRELIDKCKQLIVVYNKPPYGREVDGTVEVLDSCVEALMKCEPRLMTIEEVFDRSADREPFVFSDGKRFSWVFGDRKAEWDSETHGQRIIDFRVQFPSGTKDRRDINSYGKTWWCYTGMTDEQKRSAFDD